VAQFVKLVVIYESVGGVARPVWVSLCSWRSRMGELVEWWSCIVQLVELFVYYGPVGRVGGPV
jgi:hypothetical protein